MISLASIGAVGGPITGAVTAIASIVGGLFRMFAGGVSSAVKTALEGLRGAIAGVADQLTRFACGIARGLGAILHALHQIWLRVLWRVIQQMPRIMGRLRRLIERDLPRLLRYIERIRERVLYYYERFFRPLLVTIERLRRMLLVFRLLHMRWAERLDQRLTRLQGKVLAPLAVVLVHLSLVEMWLNTIVSAEQLIQDTIFNNTTWHQQATIIRTWWAGMTTGKGVTALLQAERLNSEFPAAQSLADMQAYLQTGTGPLAEQGRKAANELWEMMSGVV